MANLTNPALSMAAACGMFEGITEGRIQPSAAGVAPSATPTDYVAWGAANAFMLEVDALLGAGFDTQLASNATPGITVSAGGTGWGATATAGTASLGPLVKPLAMRSAARAYWAGRGEADLVTADYAVIAAGVIAAYKQFVTVIYADAS